MPLESGAWSPYLVGTLIGLLSMATFYFSNKPLSVSTAYARLAGLVGNLFAKGHTESLKFYQDKKPKIEWGEMLVFGMLLGAFIAAFTGGEITAAWVPVLWEQRFGPDVALRLGTAFAGGVIMAYGARLAGGCTSGHGISGALQLSVGSWIALVCFFVAAVATGHLLYWLGEDKESYFANAFVVTAGFVLFLGVGAILKFPKEKLVDRNISKTNPYQRLMTTLRNWQNNREIPKFLLAYYLINDAMVTVIYFTAIFLKATFGLSIHEILVLSLVFQVIAIPTTIFFGWLGDHWGLRRTIYLTLVIWIVVLALMGFAEGQYAPKAIAITLGLVLGSTQSLMRSMYSQMVPPDQSGEYFGFHALVGRASSALGPLLFGLVSALAGSQRMAMMSLGLFLLAGAILLAKTQPPSKQ